MSAPESVRYAGTPSSPLGALRRALVRAWRWPFDRVRGTRVAWSARVSPGSLLVRSTVGPHTYIAGGTVIAGARIGSYCSIAAGAKIGGMEHPWWWGSTSPRLSRLCVTDRVTTIEHDVWIGVNAVIRQGVVLGRGSVIGSGAVVLRDVPPYTIVVGVPARELRPRFPAEVILALDQSRFWECEPAEASRRLAAITYPPFAGPDA